MEILKSCAAWGDWHPQVPQGMVAVAARSGDRVRAFMVPRADYSPGMTFSPGRYVESPAFDRLPGSKAHLMTSNPSAAQPATARSRDFGWGRIIEQLNGAVESPGTETMRERPGSAKPWRQVISSVEGRL